MNANDRVTLRQIVTSDPAIDLVIVHHADGGNDFFSAKPEVESCERWRVIAVCRDIIRILEGMPRKRRSDTGGTAACQYGGTARPSGCGER